jgi:tRNA(Ile)-lysidine synthase
MKDMFTKALEAIKRHGMLSRGDTVLACVSGGIDSMAMLDVLKRLQKGLCLKIIVCHLNHNLRGAESKRDIDFVKGFCRASQIPFVGKTLKRGEVKAMDGSTQSAARELRVRFFRDTAIRYGAQRIATGHTLDDNAETVLMRLMKGSGTAGLSGILPKRGVFIRPLIDVRRREIISYAKNRHIPFVVDSSNLSERYLRNSVRLRLIPYLRKRFNPSISETLARSSCLLALDNDFIDREARAAFKKALVSAEKDRVILGREALKGLHPAIKTRVFMRSLNALDPRAWSDLGSPHLKAIVKIAEHGRPNRVLDLPTGVKVAREYERIIFSKGNVTPDPAAFDMALKVPGTTRLKRQGWVFKTGILKVRPRSLDKGGMGAFLDYDSVAGGLRLRSFRKGDVIAPLGMNGHKKVKEVFIEARVPLGQRRMTPLVASGREVVLIPGIKHSETTKVLPSTRRVLKIEWLRQGA